MNSFGFVSSDILSCVVWWLACGTRCESPSEHAAVDPPSHMGIARYVVLDLWRDCPSFVEMRMSL